jgi:tetraprenyl-beta-curcumene synthase
VEVLKVKAPSNPISLMRQIYRDILPDVHLYLKDWRRKAERIPNVELRKQAMMSIDTKTFHCEGGAIYGLLAGSHRSEVIKFIVAYQTISDYLDNLCDRSTSLDPGDFQALHQSMLHALTPEALPENYYRLREEQDDGGYLTELVQTCQDVLRQLPNYGLIKDSLHELAHYYCDLQVHKHVIEKDRVPRLKAWFDSYSDNLPVMSWYEFSACSGSTLGIFCLVSYAFQGNQSKDFYTKIKKGYFPWVQGLHILMDYFIDQEEDRRGGDLNFCFYYDDEAMMVERFLHFINEADKSIATLPDKKFHYLINRGLLGIYLADQKVRKQKYMWQAARKMIRTGGGSTFFFFLNGLLYQKAKTFPTFHW